MRKFANQPTPPDGVTQTDVGPGDEILPDDDHPSKTRRKADMHALQDLGEALARLPPVRLAALALPERLGDAIAEARQITKWGARRRQMQFIGRLMRDVDPVPIQTQLDHWAGAPSAEKARLAQVERWRTQLLSDAGAIDRLCIENAATDRPRLAALVARVHSEREHGQPPHAFRELFRMLNALLTAP